MFSHFIDEFCIEFQFKRSSSIVLGRLELRMRTVNAGEVTDLRGIDYQLRRKFRTKTIPEAVCRRLLNGTFN
jgi:hypothetical protein